VWLRGLPEGAPIAYGSVSNLDLIRIGVANRVMTDSTLPTPRLTRRPWWIYLLFALAAIGVLVAAAFFTGVLGLSIILGRLSGRGFVGTPDISGQVADIVTGDRVPGMNVCLLETYKYSGPTDGTGPSIDVRRGEVTQTDAAGIFSFAASKAQLDFFQSGDRYSISITEPVGDLVCGTDFQSALEGHGRVFQNEPSDSAGHRQRHYFPVAIVNDPGYPPPLPPSIDSPRGSLPGSVLFRKLDNPGQLRIELIPLLQNESECQGAYDSASVDLCKQANTSGYAEKWRAALSHHP